jgi:hypothetical protein
MWAADKLAVQQQLANRLASVMLSFESAQLTFVYLAAFWDVLTIEWRGIDRLRYSCIPINSIY